MASPQMSSRTGERYAPSISRLQGEAWAAWNESYHVPVIGEAYRIVSQALYQQDVHERIESLLARSEEQNRLLDAMLAKN